MILTDERLQELYEIFADRAAEKTCGAKEDIDVATALRELIERRAAPNVATVDGSR